MWPRADDVAPAAAAAGGPAVTAGCGWAVGLAADVSNSLPRRRGAPGAARPRTGSSPPARWRSPGRAARARGHAKSGSRRPATAGPSAAVRPARSATACSTTPACPISPFPSAATDGRRSHPVRSLTRKVHLPCSGYDVSARILAAQSTFSLTLRQNPRPVEYPRSTGAGRGDRRIRPTATRGENLWRTQSLRPRCMSWRRPWPSSRPPCPVRRPPRPPARPA
jgi:hypothetical protein